MKRLLSVFMVLGVLAGSAGAATADGEPARQGRTVVASYSGPFVYFASWCNPGSGGLGCVSIATGAGERFLIAKVTDTHGQPVSVRVAANTENDTLGDEITFGRFCGETTSHISFDPGAELEFYVGVPDESCAPGTATTGIVSVTLFERSVHLALRRHLRSEGAVSSVDASCRSDVPIVIQRKRSGDWVEIGSTITGSDGAFALKLSDRAGRYRAVASEINSPEQACLAAASPTTRHRH